MKLLNSAILLLGSLPLFASADRLTRLQCTCQGQSISGYDIAYTYKAARVPNQYYQVAKTCSGGLRACSQDLHFIQTWEQTAKGHTFKYSRDIWSADDYQFDNSGKKPVPTDRMITLGGGREYCIDACRRLNPALTVHANCTPEKSGKHGDCLTEYADVPNL